MFENLQVLLPVFFVWVRILYLHLSHIIVCLAAFRTVMFATSCRLARGYEATSRVYFHSVCEQAGNGAFALYYGGGFGSHLEVAQCVYVFSKVFGEGHLTWLAGGLSANKLTRRKQLLELFFCTVSFTPYYLKVNNDFSTSQEWF